jgi:thiamine-monophosphate kinase
LRASPFKPASGAGRTVSDIGERGLIDRLGKYFDKPSRKLLIAAPDDDAALWRGDAYTVGTIDTMAEHVDFRLDWPAFDWHLLGRRLISINLSDLAAMGAEPRHALVSLALRGEMPVGDVDRLYAGIVEQARKFGCSISGGDLSATRGPLMLTAAMTGSVTSASEVLRREGAKPGWSIAVTGRLGAAAAGLRLLEKGLKAKTDAERSWVRAQLDPVPRIDAGKALVSAGVRVGGDISDGLIGELQRITHIGGLGASIQVRDLPLARGLLSADWPLAVGESEDFELICVAPASVMRNAQKLLGRHSLSLTVVGVIERRAGIQWHDGDRPVRLKAAGYDHFR